MPPEGVNASTTSELESEAKDVGGKNHPPASTSPNLSAIRSSILPENSQSARFTTTAGAQHREVQGTVYVGAHPEDAGEERVLWFKLDSDGRFYPTVYTLWHNPHLVPLLYTPGFVMQKLQNGADLMTPGLANEPPFPEGAVKGAVVTVASVDKHTVPQFVGVCEIDVSALGEVQGTKGHAVRGVHWEGDEIWNWSSSSRPGKPAPEYLAEWDDEVPDVEEGVDNLKLEEREIEPEVTVDGTRETQGNVHDAQPEHDLGEDDVEPSTKGKYEKNELLLFNYYSSKADQYGCFDMYRNRRCFCEGIRVLSLQT